MKRPVSTRHLRGTTVRGRRRPAGIRRPKAFGTNRSRTTTRSCGGFRSLVEAQFRAAALARHHHAGIPEHPVTDIAGRRILAAHEVHRCAALRLVLDSTARPRTVVPNARAISTTASVTGDNSAQRCRHRAGCRHGLILPGRSEPPPEPGPLKRRSVVIKSDNTSAASLETHAQSPRRSRHWHVEQLPATSTTYPEIRCKTRTCRGLRNITRQPTKPRDRSTHATRTSTPGGPPRPPDDDHWRAGCEETRTPRSGRDRRKRTTTGHLTGGRLHSEGARR